jgi:DNA-binding IclR family transcriptional regulator
MMIAMPLQSSPAVLRAADVLAHLAAGPSRSFSVAELARELGMPRATCTTVLLALAERGFVRRDGELRYTLGPMCILVGDAAERADPALRAAADQAELLARSLSAFTAVSIRERDETRVTRVFDHAPPLSLRARAGEAVALIPPFGASFVAWDDEASIERWLQRADPQLTRREAAHYRRALAAVRQRGYTITLVTAWQPVLIEALERLADNPRRHDARSESDEATQTLAHSEYLPIDVDESARIRIAQVAAPVFGSEGSIVASIMLLGPTYELTGSQVAALGAEVAHAAQVASSEAAA